MYGKPSPTTPPPPPAKGMNSQQYYMSLYNQGYSVNDSYNAAIQQFGTGQTPPNNVANNQMISGIAQAAGTVGGAVGTTYIAKQFAAKTAAEKLAEELAAKELVNQGTAALGTTAGESVSSLAAQKAGLEGIQTASASAAKTAGAEAVGTEAASQSIGSYIVPGAQIAAGAYGGYKTSQMIGDMAAGSARDKNAVIGGAASGASIGAGIGTLVPIPGVGTAIGAGIGAAIGASVGYLGSKFGSHKGGAQFLRDKVRDVMQKNGILDNDYQGSLADGTKYDFGKDGKSMKWSEIDKYAAEHKATWDPAVSYTDALVAGQGLTGQKASDLSAWFAKAATANAGEDPNVVKANVQHFAKQQGISFDTVKSQIDKQLADKQITQDQYTSKLNSASALFDQKSTIAPPPKYQPTGNPSTGGGLRNSLEEKMGYKS